MRRTLLLLLFFALPAFALPAFAFPFSAIQDTTALSNEDYKPLPTFMVPQNATNIALEKRVTSSDDFPIIGNLAMINDGSKDHLRESWFRNEEGEYKELQPEN